MYCPYTGCALLVQWQYVFTRLKYYLSVSLDYNKCKTNIQIKLSSISHMLLGYVHIVWLQNKSIL